ncbi:hypothetical protein KCP74_00750 [Salmonella enterica subsp. enterica]|nr:hypothetical protein KCP74_00750 [Salmonella enterica subsp. enterica]
MRRRTLKSQPLTAARQQNHHYTNAELISAAYSCALRKIPVEPDPIMPAKGF